ncbi:hypothetical protein C8034_v008544 [Colletotrichum sidae]|uniref:Uncharacterized protein n=1 Tax=Colletotrichum sidae TaxID=1347389 RepID=A0A4R8TPR6_9PEZI|nr:hypothetical protein C8034_v008544 [Colletotrichum sidae]
MSLLDLGAGATLAVEAEVEAEAVAVAVMPAAYSLPRSSATRRDSYTQQNKQSRRNSSTWTGRHTAPIARFRISSLRRMYLQTANRPDPESSGLPLLPFGSEHVDSNNSLRPTRLGIYTFRCMRGQPPETPNEINKAQAQSHNQTSGAPWNPKPELHVLSVPNFLLNCTKDSV